MSRHPGGNFIFLCCVCAREGKSNCGWKFSRLKVKALFNGRFIFKHSLSKFNFHCHSQSRFFSLSIKNWSCCDILRSPAKKSQPKPSKFSSNAHVTAEKVTRKLIVAAITDSWLIISEVQWTITKNSSDLSSFLLWSAESCFWGYRDTKERQIHYMLSHLIMMESFLLTKVVLMEQKLEFFS